LRIFISDHMMKPSTTVKTYVDSGRDQEEFSDANQLLIIIDFIAKNLALPFS